MSEWQEASLADLADYINGRAIKPEECSTKQGIPVIRIKQINDPQSIEDRFCGDDLDEKNIARNGDLLFSWSATLKTILWQGPVGAINQHIFKVLPKDGIDKTFLHYLIDHSLPALTEESHGSTMKHIKKSALSEFRLQIPPLPEQKKIAEILSGTDKAIHAAKRKISKIQETKISLLNSFFQQDNSSLQARRKIDSGEISRQKFSDCLGIISGKGFEAKDYSDRGTRLIRIDNVSWGKISWDSIAFIPDEIVNENQKLLLKEGDILLALNRPITQGKLKIARCSQADLPAILYQRVGKIFPLDESIISNDFAYYLLQGILPPFITSQSVGSDQPFINLTALRDLVLPLPPPKYQNQIVDTLQSCDTLIATQNSKINKFCLIKRSLASDLLSGCKRVSV